MKRYCNTSRSRPGMAMLMVLFIVMAIAVISSGFIARSDAALQCGRNDLLRNEVDYLAWAGLEHARAWIVSPDNSGIIEISFELNNLPLSGSSGRYNLVFDSPIETAAADPNDPSTYTYAIQCTAYDTTGGDIRARSVLDATLFYDPNSTQSYYISVTRQ